MVALITVKNLGLIVEKRILLKDVSLSINSGQIVTLIGPNGGGKTTLTKCLLGLQPITSGSIARAQELKIGYVPQRFKPNPFLPLTVSYFLSLSCYDDSSLKEKVNIVKIEHLLNRSIWELSGGELQRVLLVRALLNNPNLLILDEPTQGIDLLGQKIFYQLLSKICAETGCAIFLISHDLHFVMAKSDQVICLNQHICCHGAPDSISRNPKYIEIFGPHIAPYHHDHDHTHSF